MTRSRSIVLVGVLVAIAAIWWWSRTSSENVFLDLVEQFPNAVEKRPRPDVFAVADVSLAGERRRAITTTESSRIKFRLVVPENGWLIVDIGLLEKAWTIQGDGVHFLIGLSEGPNVRWEELVNLTWNPYGNPSERRWHNLALDLSTYAGATVDLVFNTYASPPPAPGTPAANDGNGDFAAWGNPRVVVR